MATIPQGKDTPINVQTGTLPDVGGAMLDWFQPMVFSRVTKVVEGFRVVETKYDTAFRGVIQPMGPRELKILPEGQRSWTWFTLHAEPVLSLETDEVVTYLGVQTRVMSRRDYRLYGYDEYVLVQDWTGSGPEAAEE